jgi:hypothetical protein
MSTAVAVVGIVLVEELVAVEQFAGETDRGIRRVERAEIENGLCPRVV